MMTLESEQHFCLDSTEKLHLEVLRKEKKLIEKHEILSERDEISRERDINCQNMCSA